MADEKLKLRRLGDADLKRLAAGEDETISQAVRAIIAAVRKEGDAALMRYAREFDKVELPRIAYGDYSASASAGESIAEETLEVLRSSALRIKRFAEAQFKQFRDFETEIEDGVILGQRVEAIESVGAYIPGGRYPLISSALMCVIPAKVAGVKRIAVMTPPQRDGKPHPLILEAARIAGADEVYVSGGAQGIAALAYGTESVKPVDKIVGPGNAYVSTAKKFVFGDVGIDFYAGPSEVLIVADSSAKAELVAADLAAQAEHDPLARAVLVSLDEKLIGDVEEALERLAASLPTGPIIRKSIADRGGAVLVGSIEEAARVAKAIAPEHLELHVQDAKWVSEQFSVYGSLFIGSGAAEALGDYSAGINHTLPTVGATRYASGLSVKDFLCLRTSLECRPGRGKRIVAQDSAAIAALEGLAAHEQAARLRCRE
jgi:histidinol dehydrogenase